MLTTFRDVDVQMSPRDLVLREITVLGSRYASKAELRESAELVATGKIHPVVSQIVLPRAWKRCTAPCWRGHSSAAARIDWTILD